MKRLLASFRTHRRRILQSILVLAVATSAAALVVASRTARGAPRTADDVPRDVPDGTLVSWAGRVHATAMVSHGAVSASSAQSVYATVTVGADPTPGAERAPSTFVLVVDTSGSMATGDKIAFARAAADRFLAQVRDDDEIALVAYDSSPRVLVSRGAARDVRERARAAVAALVAAGGTNIGSALRVGIGELRGDSADRIRRIVLVSDGIDESGQPPETIAAVAASAAAAGIAVTTVGVGADYNEPLMTRLADVSFGNYHFLRETGDLERVLEIEYGQMGATMAQNLVAEIELPSGVSFVRASGAAAQAAGAFVTLRFGSLFGGDERRAVVELRSDPRRREGPVGDVRARLRWSDRPWGRPVTLAWKGMPLVATGDADRLAALTNPVALEEGVEVTAAQRHDEAKAAWERGDVATFHQIAEDNIAHLRTDNASLGSASVAAQIQEYEEHVRQFEASTPQSADGRLLVKDVTVANRARATRDVRP